MARYQINSAGFSGGVLLYEDPQPLDDTTVTFGLAQVGSALQSQDPQTSDQFGSSISISGDTLIVGIPSEEKVEVYTRSDNAWSYFVTLDAGSSAQSGQEFGHSVSISDHLIAVGAPNADGGAGAVFIFEFKDGAWRSARDFKRQATNLNIETTARYGDAVLLTGNTLIIGAPQALGGSTTTDRYGAIYGWSYKTFERFWVAHNPVYNPLPQNNSGFGSVLWLENENYLVAGTPTQDVVQGSTVTGAGCVYVFARTVSNQGQTTDWDIISTVTHPSATQDMFFGKSVHYAGDRMIIGMPGLTGGGGAYYFYGRPDGLAPVQELNARTAGETITDATVGSNDQQGSAVWGDPTRKSFMVGAPNNANGAVYCYEQTEAGNWHPALNSKLTASDGASGDAFGQIMLYDGGTMIVGTPNRQSGKGGLYIFS